MATRRIGAACATRTPGPSHEAAAQGRRASAPLEPRTRRARGEDKRAGSSRDDEPPRQASIQLA